MRIYIHKDNQQHGPYDEPVVAEWLRNGQCSPTDLACREGMNEWKPLGTLITLRNEDKPWLLKQRTIAWKLGAAVAWFAAFFVTFVLVLARGAHIDKSLTPEEQIKFAHSFGSSVVEVGGVGLIVMVVGLLVILSRPGKSK